MPADNKAQQVIQLTVDFCNSLYTLRHEYTFFHLLSSDVCRNYACALALICGRKQVVCLIFRSYDKRIHKY